MKFWRSSAVLSVPTVPPAAAPQAPPPAAPPEPSGRHWWKSVATGFVVLTLEGGVIGGALYAGIRYWPDAHVAVGASALARVDLPRHSGDRVTAVEAVDGSGHAVKVKFEDGRIVPVEKVPAGTRLHVEVTVQRASWIGWLVGHTETLRSVIRTPGTYLRAQFVYPREGGPVRVHFTSPVRVVRVQPLGEKPRLRTFAHPRRVVLLGLHATGTNIAGSALVSAAARPWEKLSAPVRVNWFPRGPEAKVVVRPAPKSTLVPSARITLTFSQPVKTVLGSALPKLWPRTAGAWRQPNAHTLVFTPTGLGFPLGSHVRLRLPRAIQVIAGSDPSPFRILSWKVPGGSPLRLKELLAELGYLPVTWQPDRSELAASPSAQARAAVDPPRGTFTWRYQDTPDALKGLWNSTSQRRIMVRGALMAFESTHGLNPDGHPGRAVWKALLHDMLTGQATGAGYSYVYVSEKLPQTLTLWHNGKVILKTLVNTGIYSRPTDLGTFPVYLHLSSTTMAGTNPDGSHYNDPGVPWVNYFSGGDAVHGFWRGGYGYPQSLGCVEVEPTVAGQIFPYVQVGTLVTVVPS